MTWAGTTVELGGSDFRLYWSQLYWSELYCRSEGSTNRHVSLSSCTDRVRFLLGQKSIAVPQPLYTGHKLYLVLRMGSFPGSLFGLRLLSLPTNIFFTRIGATEELQNAMMLCKPEFVLFSQFQQELLRVVTRVMR